MTKAQLRTWLRDLQAKGYDTITIQEVITKL